MQYTEVALFTDLDGTLFNSRSQVSQGNKNAIQRFTAQGGCFGISTGRSPINAKTMLPGVALNGWSVVLNGAEAYHYPQAKAVSPVYLDQQAAEDLVRWVLKALPEVNVTLFSEDRLLLVSDPAMADPVYVDGHQPLEMVSLEEAKSCRWIKILFCAPRPVLEVLNAHGREAGAQAVMNAVYTQETYLEYIPPHINKGSCLRDLRQLPEFKNKTIIAVGDYYNDLELLQEADVAVAVANALPEVKAVADHVVCSNDEDAIAYLIDTLIPAL